MANDDDMNQRLERVETAVHGLEQIDQLEKKVDQLPTKADFTVLKNDSSALRSDFTTLKSDFTTMANKVTTLLEDARDEVKKAAEGYKATLDRIENDLVELNKKVDVRFGDHDKVLANHNARITVLEASPRPEAERI